MGIRSQALSSDPTLGGAALRLGAAPGPTGRCSSRAAAGEHRFDCACGSVVSDERAGPRREVLAAPVELSRRHATQHQELHQTAVEHRRKNMAQRTYAIKTRRSKLPGCCGRTWFGNENDPGRGGRAGVVVCAGSARAYLTHRFQRTAHRVTRRPRPVMDARSCTFLKPRPPVIASGRQSLERWRTAGAARH